MRHVPPVFARAAQVALAAVLFGACNWNAFEPYQKTAPIRVHETPSNYELPFFGQQLATLQIHNAGVASSTIFASAGPTTPVAIMRAWTGSRVSESSAQLRCHLTDECPGGSDIGATLIPFETWGAHTAAAKTNCVFAPSNSLIPWAADDPRLGGEAFVLCEDESTVHFAMSEAFLEARGDNGSMLFSGFGLPSGHPLGVVVYGAYALDNKTAETRGGNLYVQQDFNAGMSAAPLGLPVPLFDPATQQAFADDPRVGDLGRQTAGSIDASGNLLLAVSQPSRARVLVVSWDGSALGAAIDKFQLRACLAAPDPTLRGFGERLLLGDVDGDGLPELFVGSDPIGGAEPGRQALYAYRGDGLPAFVADAEVCPDWTTPAQPVVCRDSETLRCDGSAFGAALALGDVDADGHGDLIVGAPLTTVGDAKEAGVVWLIPGSANGLAAERTAVLETGSHEKAHLGAAVAALRTGGRDEPVASATGQGDVYVFMCSPLEPGFGAASLCLP